MKITAFLDAICGQQGISQSLASETIEGMSPISFAAFVTDLVIATGRGTAAQKEAQATAINGDEK
jgi:hypothetical protein